VLPDVDSLRCFEAAATHLNFRAAAKHVGLSPPAFSERIKRLEDTVGAPLFTRSTRKVALTEAGRRLVPQARASLQALAGCRDAVHDLRRAPFTLVIGTRWELGMSWIVPQLAALKRGRPERSLDLVFGDSPDLLQKAATGTIDAVVTSSRLASARLVWTVLHEERYAFVAAPRTVKQAPLTGTDDARAHVLVDVSPEMPLFRYLLDASPAGEAWRFKEVERLGAIGAIRARVLEGAGVAVLPEYLVAQDLAKKRLVRLLPKRRLALDHFRLVWRTGHPQEDQLYALAEEMKRAPLR
jgi:LysR family transcriptional regulator, glycine cleavage system transcriptional activator